MPRSRKPRVQLTPEQKRLRRQQRAQLRKERQASAEARSGQVKSKHEEEGRGRTDDLPVPGENRSEQFWVRTKDRMAAMKILNDHRERPYWMSMPAVGSAPIAHMFPCNLFTRDGRWYYGFLFRFHRDKFFREMRSRGARKELTA